MSARPKVVDCKYCGNPTVMTETKLCDGCWELDHRLSNTPVVRRILEAHGFFKEEHRMCEALEKIQAITGETQHRPYTALSWIDEIARKGRC